MSDACCDQPSEPATSSSSRPSSGPLGPIRPGAAPGRARSESSTRLQQLLARPVRPTPPPPLPPPRPFGWARCRPLPSHHASLPRLGPGTTQARGPSRAHGGREARPLWLWRRTRLGSSWAPALAPLVAVFATPPVTLFTECAFKFPANQNARATSSNSPSPRVPRANLGQGSYGQLGARSGSALARHPPVTLVGPAAPPVTPTDESNSPFPPVPRANLGQGSYGRLGARPGSALARHPPVNLVWPAAPPATD